MILSLNMTRRVVNSVNWMLPPKRLGWRVLWNALPVIYVLKHRHIVVVVDSLCLLVCGCANGYAIHIFPECHFCED